MQQRCRTRAAVALRLTRREAIDAYHDWRALALAVNAAKRARGKQGRTLARALVAALRRDVDRLEAECSRLSIDADQARREYADGWNAAVLARREAKKYQRKMTDEERRALAVAALARGREAQAAARAAAKAGPAPAPRARRASLGLGGLDEVPAAFRE